MSDLLTISASEYPDSCKRKRQWQCVQTMDLISRLFWKAIIIASIFLPYFFIFLYFPPNTICPCTCIFIEIDIVVFWRKGLLLWRELVVKLYLNLCQGWNEWSSTNLIPNPLYSFGQQPKKFSLGNIWVWSLPTTPNEGIAEGFLAPHSILSFLGITLTRKY